MPRPISIPSHQDEPGRRLRRVREHLGLRYRDVEEATQLIANARGNPEFVVGLSRLADIENRGTLPSIYRLYSLCAVYGVTIGGVLRWYGIDLGWMAADLARLSHNQSRAIDVDDADGEVLEFPDLGTWTATSRTSYLSRQIRQWGRLPLRMVAHTEVRHRRYAFVGTDDWGMYPLIRPGSFLQIDEGSRKPRLGPWLTEADRPIYFIEHREGFLCAWCWLKGRNLTVQFHPSSGRPPLSFECPEEAEIIGQVVGLATRLDPARRRHIRS